MTATFTQIVSLDQMMSTVRRITARYTESQMPDTQIQYYINLAYTLHFPLQFKNLKLTKPYVFTTVPNVDTYQFVYEEGLKVIPQQPTTPPSNNSLSVPGNIQINPPVYCQGYLLRYYQDKTNFYNRWPKLSVNQIINHGTGISSTTPNQYTGTIPPFPFLRAQLDIFGNVTEAGVLISAIVNVPTSGDSGFNYVITDIPQPDSNVGNLVDSLGNTVGTVNYLTGFYGFTPANSTVIPADATIYASVVPYQASRPTDVIFYNQQITLRPVPLQIYQIEFQISQQPTQLIAANEAPELDEWYLLLCALAADLIYIDFPDPQGRAENQATLEKQILIAQRRSLRQMGSQRAQTIFTSQGWRNTASYFWGSEYSGGL